MKKALLLISGFLAIFSGNAFGGPVNPQTARRIALNQLHAMNLMSTSASDDSLTDISATLGCSHLYAFNRPGGGFVIVSGDDRTRPVLAYSDEGRLDSADLPPAAKAMIEGYEQQLAAIAAGAEPITYFKQKSSSSVSPLVSSNWEQAGFGYNSMCPVDSSCTGSMNYHSVTGCGATALAQVMRHWKFPTHGIGSHCYINTWPIGHEDTICADFAHTTYDFDNMPDALGATSTPEQINAVATLQFHAGVAMDMSYAGNYGSSVGNPYQLGPYRYYNYYASVRYFGYSPKAYEACNRNYTDKEWIELMKESLDHQRPVPYSGYGSWGHVFILDGYDKDVFHINWGWGQCNGYFSLDHLSVNGMNFTGTDNALVNMRPIPFSQWSFTELLDDLSLDSVYRNGQEMTNSTYRFTNIGNVPDTFYLCHALLVLYDYSFVKWLDCSRQVIAPGDTVDYRFSYTADLPEGDYYLATFRSNEPVDLNAKNSRGAMCFPTARKCYAPFYVPADGSPSTGIVESHTETGIRIFPNPARSVCTIESDCGLQDARVQLYDVCGRMVKSLPAEGTHTSLSLEGLAPGMYLIRVSDMQRVMCVQKLAIQ